MYVNVKLARKCRINGSLVPLIMAVVLGATIMAVSPVEGVSAEKISLETADTRTAARTEPFTRTEEEPCSAQNCTVSFGTVPQQAWLDVRSVSCLIEIADDEILAAAALVANNGSNDLMVPRKVGRGSRGTTYAFNHSTRLRIDERHEYWVSFLAGKDELTGSAVCKVAGEMAFVK